MLAMLPALHVMHRNHRHFEVFIGVFHFAISFMYSVAESLGVDFFLEELQWHFISDVLSLTYVLLVCVHLMGFQREDVNIVLRYLAFAFTWLAKDKDGWDTTMLETVLIASYICALLVRRLVQRDAEMLPLSSHHLLRAVLGGVACLFFLFVMDTEDDEATRFTTIQYHVICRGLMHVIGGVGLYHAWLSVPCKSAKKFDSMPIYSTYV